MFKQTRTLKCWIHLFLMFDPTANLVCLLVIAHLPGCTPHTGLVSSNLTMTISKNGLSEHDPFDHPTTCLVVEPTPLKNMKVSWDDYSQYMEK